MQSLGERMDNNGITPHATKTCPGCNSILEYWATICPKCYFEYGMVKDDISIKTPSKIKFAFSITFFVAGVIILLFVKPQHGLLAVCLLNCSMVLLRKNGSDNVPSRRKNVSKITFNIIIAAIVFLSLHKILNAKPQLINNYWFTICIKVIYCATFIAIYFKGFSAIYCKHKQIRPKRIV
jgi:hypothetical protein